MKKSFRPTAIPLVSCDPFFSVWSFSDKINEDKTRHWTGASQSLFGVLTVDDIPYVFLGVKEASNIQTVAERTIEQTSVTVRPTTTVYTFTHPACDLKVTFYTPLFMHRLEVLSRPVSYIDYEITPKEEGHTFEVYFDVSCQLSGDPVGQTYDVFKEDGHAYLGNHEQNILKESGDDVRIAWGYLHLVHKNAHVANFSHRLDVLKIHPGLKTYPLIMSRPIPFHFAPVLYTVSNELKDRFIIAYDDVHSIVHYGKHVDAYYKTVYGDFNSMLKVAVAEADQLKAECEIFDKKMIADMEKINSTYAKIGALAYRQAVSAHKLVNIDGKPFFFSKENFSNGCMATLDVTYPSIPLFLIYNPELVRGMMRPLFEYARTAQWGNLPFAPHDCGQYPFCNGQVYGVEDGIVNENVQMPVEECGNAILVMAVLDKVDGNRELLEENKDLLKMWADYLVEHGYDPSNQLCTDDFAGHLAHNCNLSLKAIVALGAYGKLFNEPKYGEIAKEMADRWVRDAKVQNGKGYRLTFDNNDSWSMKYNIIWDKILDLGLFDSSVSEEEVEVYKQKMNRYGTPLDSRADYTKLDWMEWTTVMTDDPEYTQSVCDCIARMIEESADRVPITDWYYTSSARQAGFQARSVLGGFYINMLKNKLTKPN